MPRGIIFYEGPSMLTGAPIVAIATNLAGTRSKNVKTGDMIQTWIMAADQPPVEAAKLGMDSAVCGDCQYRPANGGGCYVQLWSGVTNVWKAWRNGAYGAAVPPEGLSGLFAGRLVRTYRPWARCLGAGAVVVFGLLGSPALLFNAGFTNFVMGIAVVASATYLSARTLQSARTLGWFLVLAAGVTTLGLWSPLMLGLAPAGLVVAAALWRALDTPARHRRFVAIVWALLSAGTIGVLALHQSRAILEVGDSSTTEFTEEIGAVGVGMIPFNTGMALAAPLLAILAAIVVRRRGTGMMVAVAAPTLMVGVLALVFASGADANKVPRLQSYYVLKALDGMLILIVPILAALMAATLVRCLAPTSATTKIAGSLAVGVVGLSAFGYVGFHPDEPWDTFSAAPGIEAGKVRASSVDDSWVGVAVLAGVDGAQRQPGFTPMLWDGSGHLPNLWVRTLTGVLSSQEADFYSGLPQFPYGSETVNYVTFALNLKPSLDLALIWFRPSTGELLTDSEKQWPPGRTTIVSVPMTTSPLCPECSSSVGDK